MDEETARNKQEKSILCSLQYESKLTIVKLMIVSTFHY